MKINELNTIISYRKTQSEACDTEVSNKMFGADFNPDDGLDVEKAPQDVHQDKKTYTKTQKQENGTEITLVYSSKDDKLLSKTTKPPFGNQTTETYFAGTTILNKIVEVDKDNKPVSETQFYDASPYTKKSDIHYKSDGKSIDYEFHYNKEDDLNASSSTFYSNNGRTEFQYDNGEMISQTAYREDGSLKYEVQKLIENGRDVCKEKRLRKDGTLFSEGYKQSMSVETPIQETRYGKDGKEVVGKKYVDEQGNHISERYQDDILYVKEQYDNFSSRKNLQSRILYNPDRSVYLDIKYGKNGEILDYTKNAKTNNKKYDLFKDEFLNGKIDAEFKQGKSGICYFASEVKSMLSTKEGKEIINDCLNYDKESQIATVKFNGANKEYSFSKDEIKKAMGRLSTGDPDFTVLVMGYEVYRNERTNRTVDGGLGGEVFKAFTGKDDENNIIMGRLAPIRNKDLDYLQKQLNSGHYAVTAGTPPASQDLEFGEKEKKAGLEHSHGYCVSKITKSDVYLINPNTNKTTKISREKFLDSFFTYSAADLSAK